MPMQQLIGKHRIFTDGDVVRVQLEGVVDLPEMTALQRVYEERLLVHPRLFSVLEVARAVTPSPQVRKGMADWRRQHKVAGSVVVGASLPIRTIGGLYLRATQLLGLHTWPVRFVDSPAAVPASLDELRQNPKAPAPA